MRVSRPLDNPVDTEPDHDGPSKAAPTTAKEIDFHDRSLGPRRVNAGAHLARGTSFLGTKADGEGFRADVCVYVLPRARTHARKRASTSSHFFLSCNFSRGMRAWAMAFSFFFFFVCCFFSFFFYCCRRAGPDNGLQSLRASEPRNSRGRGAVRNHDDGVCDNRPGHCATRRQRAKPTEQQ